MVVVGRVGAVVGCGHGEYPVEKSGSSYGAEAQAEANEQRAQRDRDNVDDMATFLVARTRLAGVDEWQAERVSQIGLEADRRREEHRGDARRRWSGSGVGENSSPRWRSWPTLRGGGLFFPPPPPPPKKNTNDAAQPLGAEAVQHNGSQASAGAARLEARGPHWTPPVLQLRWPTGLFATPLREPTDYRSASLAAIWPAMATAAGWVWL